MRSPSFISDPFFKAAQIGRSRNKCEVTGNRTHIRKACTKQLSYTCSYRYTLIGNRMCGTSSVVEGGTGGGGTGGEGHGGEEAWWGGKATAKQTESEDILDIGVSYVKTNQSYILPMIRCSYSGIRDNPGVKWMSFAWRLLRIYTRRC